MDRQALVFAHGVVAVDENSVRIVDDAVADGVGKGGFADFLVPAADIELGAEDGGSFFVAGFGNFEQVPCLEILEGVKQPFVDDEQPELGEVFDELSIVALGAGDGEFTEQLGQPDVTDGVEIHVGGYAKGVGNIRFAAARRAENYDVVALFDIVAGAEPRNLRLVQFPVRAILDVFKASVGEGISCVSD